MCGLRTSPRRWQANFGEIITAMGFVAHPRHPCLCIKQYGDAMIMMCCHVDDLLVVGRPHKVAEVFQELKRQVDVTYAEVTASTTYLVRRLEMRKDEVIFGIDAKHMENILDEIGLKALKVGQRAEVGEGQGGWPGRT
jgi:hypothetical protein